MSTPAWASSRAQRHRRRCAPASGRAWCPRRRPRPPRGRAESRATGAGPPTAAQWGFPPALPLPLTRTLVPRDWRALRAGAASSSMRDRSRTMSPERRATKAERVAQPVLEVALVAEVDVLRAAREEHERGRLDGRLGGVVELGPPIADRRRRLSERGLAEHPVERPGRDAAPPAARRSPPRHRAPCPPAARSWR